MPGVARFRPKPTAGRLRTVDGSLSAQYEHTVIINGAAPILVTEVEGGYV